jgi:hypothetical protein
MKPGANTARMTKRKYQPSRNTQAGTMNEPSRRRIVQKSLLARTAS